MRVLAIETTCDETAASVVENIGDGVKVLSNIVASSASIHQKYGGVVPEVAAREQIKSVIPVLTESLENIPIETIDAVCVSYGPGLMGSLLVGVETAKTLATFWNKPLIKVNHMGAHVAANWIIHKVGSEVPTLPAIGLVVSGGHTDLIYMESLSRWKWIGGTRDDAAGEAFDKAARILNLPYPGGPSIQKATEMVANNLSRKFRLPRPMINDDGLEMSFSGLKAALAKIVSSFTYNKEDSFLLAKEFNEAVVDVLVSKTLRAAEEYKTLNIIVAGGVAANKLLRENLALQFKNNLFIPDLKYCGDNASMVGAAALLKINYTDPKDLFPVPGLSTIENETEK